MLKSKIVRPLDQTEKEWTNTDTMLTDDNDDKENQIEYQQVLLNGSNY